jgi:benzoylformate decarboxylase
MSTPTVREATYNLLRGLGLTTMFGNPGSTEETFLQDFPSDFTYILGLHEASVVAMADGYAQATRRPALVNLHTAAGLGNAMGSLVAAYQGRTPIVVTAGQQIREMLIHEPYLTNIDATELPRPWVKWSYQPTRPQDVPAALMRAYSIAAQPPAGPVFVSIPFGDWAEPALGAAVIRAVSTRVAPDPARLAMFGDLINRAARPALVFGDEHDRSDGWAAGVAFAEKLGAPVFGAPLPDRVSFPEDHPLYAGQLPMSIGGAGDALQDHDLVVVIGAQIFRYYAYVPGNYVPDGTAVLHLTSDPGHAGSAPVGDSLLGDTRLALEELIRQISSRPTTSDRPAQSPPPVPQGATLGQPLLPDQIYAALAAGWPRDAVLVNEATSTMAERRQWLPVTQSASYFTTPSGGLGWAMPAAVGIALADRRRGITRPVLVTIGDGSFQYSIQSLWTAAAHHLPIVFVVLVNNEYSVLKSFAHLEHTSGVPGLDIPGLDIIALATGFGARGVSAHTQDEIVAELATGLRADGPTVIAVPTNSPLVSLA